MPPSCKYFANNFGSAVWMEKIGELGQVSGIFKISPNAVLDAMSVEWSVCMRCCKCVASYYGI
jgi:hypothetical protein